MFLFMFSMAANAQMIRLVRHHSQPFSGFNSEYKYLLADEVSLRAEPSAESALLDVLPIATKVVLIEQTKEPETLNGLNSYWYLAIVGDKRGWIWGGYVASAAFGSHGTPGVKFLIGYRAIPPFKGGNGKLYPRTNIQIRAIWNSVMIDSLEFDATVYEYLSAGSRGSCGLENVEDVLFIHKPCRGGCGCETGDHIIFWSNRKLHKVIDVMGTADADFSGGDEIIFPSHLYGTPGYIKIHTNMMENPVEMEGKEQHRYYQRVLTTKWYTWSNGKLIAATNREVERKVLCYDSEEHQVVDCNQL